MFKIGDFSKLGQVSTRMLRHYDKLGLLQPSHTDEWTSYRYYTSDQLPRLNRIIALKELGFTLEQVATLIDNTAALSIDKMRGMLAMRQAEIEQELADKKLQLKRVEARLLQIEQEGQPTPYEIVVKHLPAQPIASVRQIVPSIKEMGYYCQTMYAQLYQSLRTTAITPLQPEITLYHNDEYVEGDLDVETAVAIQPKHLTHSSPNDNITLREIPEEALAACLYYEGPFPELEGAVFALLNWIGVQNHIIAGPMRELHLSGPAHPNGKKVVDSAVIELQLPIQPASL
ncbi:MAG: MerR family transcriptional regulator [Anaerolineales bacterium]|nr:MerR family transcriptional regulator [Anaerolineales bacterium]